MRKKNILKIHLLGEFYMENKNYRFPQETKKSTQLILLIAYLIMYRHTVVSKEKLISILWKEDESDKPEGALRNLVYRARKELQKFYPDKEDVSFILSKGNTYAWNTEIPCEIDVVAMDQLCKAIETEENPDLCYKSCIDLLSNYMEDFMFEFHSQSWVELQKNYYDNILMRAINRTCKLLMEQERYDEVIKLCDILGFKHYANNHIHEYKLEAYRQTHQLSLALSYYHKVADMYYGRLGIEVTPLCREIYEDVVKCISSNPVDVHELEQQLKDDHRHDGTFYCDFDVFKNIYQMNLRSARRSSRSRYLVLLTMQQPEDLKEEIQQRESDILRDVITTELRKNDVFSKCSPFQYSLIIATASIEGCDKAISRIVDKFEQKKLVAESTLVYEYKHIS
ncbi:winged helix-turn-helix domain-containing protein [[Clostridium] innocuum]|nr:winged helix-turn-helix domain-containing protein [[Clostridium] innocuum]